MPDITVAIVDDHPVVCEGLAGVISDCQGLSLAGVADTASKAIAMVLDLAPDILVLDLNIPGSGQSVLVEIARQNSPTSAIVLSMSDQPGDVIGCLRLGAAAYVLKGTSGKELCTVIRSVAEGNSYVTPHLAARVIASLNLPAVSGGGDEVRSLSKREAEIYDLVRKGCCNKDIGRRLSLSEKTVKHYLTNMFKKLEVRNRTELALHSPWK